MKKDYLDVFGNLEYDVVHYDMHETIIQYDEPISKLRYMVSGKAKIYMVHEDGKRSIIHFLRKNEYLGELSLIGIEKHPKHVVAMCDCTCLTVDMHKAKEVLLRDADFMLKMSQYIGQKLLDRTWFNAKSLNYELKHRLAAYILLAENKGYYKEKHTETADFLSVSYRHLLQTIKDFQSLGLLVKSGRGYMVDIEGLTRLASDFESFYKTK